VLAETAALIQCIVHSAKATIPNHPCIWLHVLKRNPHPSAMKFMRGPNTSGIRFMVDIRAVLREKSWVVDVRNSTQKVCVWPGMKLDEAHRTGKFDQTMQVALDNTHVADRGAVTVCTTARRGM
jgi:hypothetical protein